MRPEQNETVTRKDRDFLDYLLYALAGSAFAAISYSFLIWLQF